MAELHNGDGHAASDEDTALNQPGRQQQDPDQTAYEHESSMELPREPSGAADEEEAHYMPIRSGGAFRTHHHPHPHLPFAPRDPEWTSRRYAGGPALFLARQRTREMIHDAQREELAEVATVLSRRRSSVVASEAHRAAGEQPAEEVDPALDPLSPEFDLYKWAQNFIVELREEGHESISTGVVYKNLSVYGSGAALQLQSTVSSVLTSVLRPGELFSFGKKQPRRILHDFDGIIRGGEMLVVLGRPGSGCSTLLKTLSGELHGLALDKKSTINYGGIPQSQMKKEFKGEAIYNQEVDKHFPHLTVGQTLEFAASVRTPSHRIQNMSRSEYCRYIARVVMAVCGLSHTYNTKVGNDFIRGVSGGERKRVSIAEMIVAGSPFTAWDNSTRGLDAATALKFVRTLRLSSDLGNNVNAVAIYQASQAIYDIFDKATVLYEGRQIYFGPAGDAKAFFQRQGWLCPPRQTTGDFLTSVTNPQERRAGPGMENQVPRTPEDFERYWRTSPEYQALLTEIAESEQKLDVKGGKDETIARFRQQKNYRQAQHVRPKSPYRISLAMQVRLNTKRAYQRIWNDIAATLTQTVVHAVMALIIGSIFYGTPDATAGFYSKGSVLFMAILLNALTAIAEISNLYAQRPIVEKHASYAFYHPATEAAAGILADIPIKFLTATVFNLIIYFMAGLRREPAQFFLFFLITYVSTFIMTAVFRTMAAITSTISQAMTLAGVLVLALVIYTGFVIQVPSMHPWFSWIRWINPIYYAFEILVANEFHGQNFTCSNIFPPYSPPQGDSWVCVTPGAVPGQYTVSGDAFIGTNYSYSYSHVWRNFGILIGFLIGFLALYLAATEINSVTTSTAEALVFQRGHVPPEYLQNKGGKDDEERRADASASAAASTTQATRESSSDGNGHAKDSNGAAQVNQAIQPQTDIFTWRDVVYDIKIKGEPRRLLDNVAGWVKPGTLTALMGVSGAGKTTLLDVLAERTSIGVITGDMLVNGRPRDASFQRNTGYVQQQDLHLQTATVRESLRFSAMLRQPQSVSTHEKYEFVEQVIKMLNMESFASAIVGVPGEGLNVEQRKLLTIGVELVAKPKLLLFLDEPTSGLDSQSSWAICVFLRKLADAGQAVLCTVHQPSAILFQEFDRLLFLAKGGRTVYFGEIGANSRTLLDYFESHGAERPCGDEENPAEYMLEVVNKGINTDGQDWHVVWEASAERHAVGAEIDRIHAEKRAQEQDKASAAAHSEFAMPLMVQMRVVTARLFQQYWRMPSYIFAKWLLGVAAGLFIGFTFYHANSTEAGMQNVMFAVFMVTTIFTTLVQQIQPLFITQRELYEVRERPSKAYSWKAFLLANIIVEFPFQIVTGVLIYACFYFPVLGANQSPDRQGLILLFIIQLFLYASAFAHMTVATLPNAQAAGGIVTFFTMMSTIFNGVLQSPTALPGFWIFMYRVSPFTYWVGGIVATALHGRQVHCSASETATFDPPAGMTCGQYLSPLTSQAAAASSGVLQNPGATSGCHYCPYQDADQYLAGANIFWSQRWRNFGIFWAYIVFDIAVAVLVYYLFRVRTGSRRASVLKDWMARRAEQARLKEAAKGDGEEEDEEGSGEDGVAAAGAASPPVEKTRDNGSP